MKIINIVFIVLILFTTLGCTNKNQPSINKKNVVQINNKESNYKQDYSLALSYLPVFILMTPFILVKAISSGLSKKEQE